jgi:hypothetical protein
MKKIIYFLAIFLLSVPATNAQTTINSSDLPHANDTFRVSIGQQSSAVNVSLTGPASIWDYSMLLPSSQRVDSFVDEAATNPLFSVVFIDIPLNPNRANQATPSFEFNLGTLISLSDVYNFYYNSNASYKQVGLGANVNGIPLPITYSPHDIVYKLPLQYPSTDSAASGYSVDLTSTLGIFYKVNQTRKNEVDGWGTLTTPYGTFDAVRVHSTVVRRDSLYLDTLGVGFNFPEITTHEYKWLGTGQGIPLLQINMNSGLVTQVVYKDSLRSLVGIGERDPLLQELDVFPNPASSNVTLTYELKRSSLVDIDIVSANGAVVNIYDSKILAAGVHHYSLDLQEKNISPGTYFIRMSVNGKSYVRTLVVSGNE